MLEIYTTGGGETLTATLNAIAVFFSTANANALMSIGIFAGFAVFLFQVAFGANLRVFFMNLSMMGIIGTITMGHKSDVIIFDSTEGPLWFQTVDNVPSSVAYIGSATSSVSTALTRLIEAIYSPPTDLAYQRHGMLFGATLVTKSARWRAVSSSIHENLTNFMDQCVLDAVDLRYVQPDVYTRSGNIEATIVANMPNALAYYDVATQSTRLCSEGWPDIANAINAEVNVVLAAQAASSFQGTDAATAIADMRNVIQDFSSFAGYAAISAEEHIKQAMLIAAFDDAANRGISATGNAAALEHLQSARAEVQTRSSYQAIGANALSWVPYLKIVFENLYYGAFPIALALMMTPLCLSVVRGYFGGFIWLASWEPLSAILHALMMNATAERFAAITSASTSGAYTESVMSWANHFGVYAIGQDIAVMAGYLMMSVPFVAAAMFFGTNRMVGLATSLLAVSQSAASETGREIATGNLAYGNASVGNRSFRNFNLDNYARNNRSFDNVSANREVTSPYRDVGRSTYFGADGSQVTTNSDGTLGIQGGSSLVNTARGVTVGNNIVGALQRRSNEVEERGTAARNTFSNSVARLSQQSSSFAQQIQNGQAFTSGRGVNISAEEREALTSSVSRLNQFAESHDVSRQTALQAALTASAGGSFGFLSAEARTNLIRQGVSEDKFNSLVQASRSEGIDTVVSDLTRASIDFNSSDSVTSTRSGDKTLRDTLDDLSQQARTAEVYDRASSAYSEAVDRTKSTFVENRHALTGEYTDWLRQQGYTDPQIVELLNGRGNDQKQEAALIEAFSRQYADRLVEPVRGSNFDAPLPAPGNPGSPPNQGDVYDYRDGSFYRDFANKQLEVEGAILRERSSLPSSSDGRATIEDSASELRGRNADASSNSDAARLHGVTGGDVGNTGGLARNVGNLLGWATGASGGRVDNNGFYQASNVSYALDGAVRSQPPKPELVADISRDAALLGNNIGVRITSGGQPSSGPNRIGSHRHDNGNAVDFALTRNGRIVTPEQDPELYASFIELSARDNPGIGHYDWGLHVGGGNPAFWGPDTTSRTADPAFSAAYRRGRQTGQ